MHTATFLRPAIAALVLLLSGCASDGGQQQAPPSAPAVAAHPTPPAPPARALPPLRAPSAQEIAAGIQVAQLGLAASGGLVDLRLKVLDPVKVKALLADPANAPVLESGDRPPLRAPHKALHGARFSRGQVFYILYPNLRGAVTAGAAVTVVMGAARLGPVTAQ